MRRLWLSAVFGFVMSGSAQADPIEFRYSLDSFTDRSNALEAMVGIGALRPLGRDLHFGVTLYSAAGGDAGGLFVGGFELIKRWSLGPDWALELGGFIGGGGGAGLVPGDGLMTRASLGVKRRLTDEASVLVALSYVDIAGSPVSTPAISVGIARDISFAFGAGHSGPVKTGRKLRAVKAIAKQFYPNGNTRSGRPLTTMSLAGFEASFASSPTSKGETFIQSSGAVAGDGEGYADFQIGYRWATAPAGTRAFVEMAGGFAGGGDVDTGGGVIASLGFGGALSIGRGLSLEAGVQGTMAIDGNFRAISPFIRGVYEFGAGRKARQNWQLSLGMTAQHAGDGYRRAGNPATANPVLVETSLDLLLTERWYLTGNAQTVALGDAGGYAIGLLGLGYQMPVSQRWSVAFEGHVGAAGGGGIDTGGGLVAAAKAELDYWVNDNTAISGGIGYMHSRGGARPATLHLGLKTRFSTF